MDVDVRLGGQCLPAGTARDSPEKYVDMRESLRTVAALVGEGLFALRDEAMWHFETRYRSREDWAEFVNKPNCGGVEVDQALLDRALSHRDGLIVLTEENLAKVYTRRGSAADV